MPERYKCFSMDKDGLEFEFECTKELICLEEFHSGNGYRHEVDTSTPNYFRNWFI